MNNRGNVGKPHWTDDINNHFPANLIIGFLAPSTRSSVFSTAMFCLLITLFALGLNTVLGYAIGAFLVYFFAESLSWNFIPEYRDSHYLVGLISSLAMAAALSNLFFSFWWAFLVIIIVWASPFAIAIGIIKLKRFALEQWDIFWEKKLTEWSSEVRRGER